jgi:hypothetical protein
VSYDTPEVQWKLYGPKAPPGVSFHHETWTPDKTVLTRETTRWHRLGFRLDRRASDKTYRDPRYVESSRLVMRSVRLRVPLWLVALTFLAGGVPGLLALRRRLRPAAGLCPACGYDLRATPDRCPECGTAAGDASAR